MIPTITESGALKKENTSIVTGQEELEKYLTFGCLFINCLCSVLLLHLVKCILIFFFLHNESPLYSGSSLQRGKDWSLQPLLSLVAQTSKLDPRGSGEVLKGPT